MFKDTHTGCRRSIAWQVLLCLLSLTAEVANAEDGRRPGSLDGSYAACDRDTALRLGYLEEHLTDASRYAGLWWHTWNGVFVGGMAFQGARAALEDDKGRRAALIASAVKASIGLARNLTSPPAARDGIDSLAELDLNDSEECEARLALAESLMKRNAEEAEGNRWGWKPHLFNVLLNMTAAVIVAETHDEPSAYWDAGIGIAVGELRIWSYPFQAERNWNDYRIGIGAGNPAAPEGPSVGLAPWQRGLKLVVRY